MGRGAQHRIWKWVLVIVSFLMLLFSLSLISQGAEVSVFEERVPTTSYVAITTYVTRQVPQTQILFSRSDLIIPTWSYLYSGPYRLDVGRTLKISWEADTSVNVYVMNDVDWQSRFFGAPTRWRASKVGSSGTIAFYVQYDEPIYIQVLCPTWCNAKLYRWVGEVVWFENIVDAIVQTKAIQTEITQLRTILQTSRITGGYILAIISGALFIAGVILILAPTGGISKEESVKLSNYREYLHNLKQLKIQMNLLRTMYEKGEIGEDAYQRLGDEINEKISGLRNIITQERTACEKELKSLEENIVVLKKRSEELIVRRRIGLIDENAFEDEMKQIRKDLEDMESRREYLKSLLEALTAEEN
jgi:gas vesicle protein